MTLALPPADGAKPWFDDDYTDGSQKARDRLLFSS